MTTNKPSSEQKAADGVAHNLRRAVCLKRLHQWHWISSALCLLGMLLFSVTGITLNHATQIEAKPTVTKRAATVSADLRESLRRFSAAHVATADAASSLPPELRRWVAQTWSVQLDERQAAEWSSDELYIALPRPGGDAWLRIGFADGEAEYELTDRGWISWLNDLHKGRNTGAAWNGFIDIFAAACLVFALTGLLILKFHAANRPSTWPVVGLGVLIPALLALLFMH